VVAAVSALLGLAATPMVSACVGWPFAAKVMLSIALIAPLGFVMGMPFPTGLRLLDAWHAPAVRWAWSLNAAASVFGAVAALFVAIYLGLTQALLTGSLLYAAAAIIRRRATMQLAR